MSEQNPEIRTYFEELARKWPSRLIARDQVPNFTGGIISKGRMANLDSLGEGPPGRFRLGRKVCYPVGPFIEWMIGRAEPIERREA